MSDNQIFADAFNFFIYGGRPVIRPEQLHPLDTAVSQTVYRQQDHHTLFKLRDELKYVSLMADVSTAYAILGIENQSSIHQAMPVCSLLYDALQYTSQVQHIAAAHLRKQEYGQDGGEFLSGFHRQDRLIPVVTLVINSCTNANLQFDETEEEIDMCKAIDDMRMESRNEGIDIGRNEGIDIGLERGRNEERKSFATSLLQDGTLSLDKIAALTKLSLAEVTAIANTLSA